MGTRYMTETLWSTETLNGRIIYIVQIDYTDPDVKPEYWHEVHTVNGRELFKESISSRDAANLIMALGMNKRDY